VLAFIAECWHMRWIDANRRAKCGGRVQGFWCPCLQGLRRLRENSIVIAELFSSRRLDRV
jgi:hypothetical protein